VNIIFFEGGKMNLQKVKVFSCLCIVFIFVGCSTKDVCFTVKAPPAGFPDKYTANQDKYKFSTMKVYPFKSNIKKYGSSLGSMVEGGISREGFISVVPNGADCTLSGVLTVGKIETMTSRSKDECIKFEKFKPKKVPCIKYSYTKKNAVKFDYKLRANGKLVASETFTKSYNETWTSNESSSDAKAEALSDEEIITHSLAAVARGTVVDVSPHKAEICRKLQKAGNDDIKLGITYLVNGRMDQAISIWGQCVKNAKTDKVKAAAYYNIGVCKESLCQYKEAFEFYSKANQLLPIKERYIKALTRVEESDGECATL